MSATRNRLCLVAIRVPASELRAWKRSAENAGITLSQWIRNNAAWSVPSEHRPPRRWPVENEEVTNGNES